MKLLSLNVWVGTKDSLLFDFIKEQSSAVDIFCFQEVMDSKTDLEKLPDGSRPKLLAELTELLPEFQVVFSPSMLGFSLDGPVSFSAKWGLATFVKKPIVVLESGKKFISGNPKETILPDKTNEPHMMQYNLLEADGKKFWSVNLHGHWYPGDKEDSPVRIRQSEIVTETLSGLSGPKILAGDFNLLPTTKSFKMLEAGMRNLISEYNIHSTRNNVSWSKYVGLPKQYFSDYILVSQDVNVQNFEVPYNEVSDHLPMVLDFSL